MWKWQPYRVFWNWQLMVCMAIKIPVILPALSPWWRPRTRVLTIWLKVLSLGKYVLNSLLWANVPKGVSSNAVNTPNLAGARLNIISFRLGFLIRVANARRLINSVLLCSRLPDTRWSELAWCSIVIISVIILPGPQGPITQLLVLQWSVFNPLGLLLTVAITTIGALFKWWTVERILALSNPGSTILSNIRLGP